MGAALEEKDGGMVETVPIPDTFVQGLAEVEMLDNGYACWVFWRRKNGVKEVALRLLMSLGAIDEVRAMTDQAVAAMMRGVN